MKSCSCPLDCEGVSYSYTVVSYPTLVEDECMDLSTARQMFGEYHYGNEPPHFVRLYEMMFENRTNFVSHANSFIVCK